MKQSRGNNIYTFEELLETQGYIVYTNVGMSMLPLLRQKKDIIEIRKIKPGSRKKYDVVLYKRDGKYILHRILKVLPDGYIIAGDNNTFIETDIKDGDILGIMTRIVRNGKTITPENWFYKIYVHLWCDFYPIRAMILFGKAFFRALIRRITRRWQEMNAKNAE